MPDTRQIQNICGQLERGEIDNAQFLEQFTRELAERIGCSRAGVWIFIETAQGRALRCVAMYDAARDRMVDAPDMVGAEASRYFDALARDGCIVAPDALAHPATAGMEGEYLQHHDVRSLLDVCFSVNGVLFGTFSCEQVGHPVAWSPRQLQLLRKIGSRASLALMHAVDADARTAPGALWEPSSPNRLATMPMPLDDARKKSP